MATCIEQRGRNSWRVTVSAGYKEGKQQKIHRSFRFPEGWSPDKQKKEVEKCAARLLTEFCNNQVTPGRDLLFSDFAELWEKEYAQINLEEKNYYCAQTRLKLHILPYFGKIRMSQIRTLTITKFVNQLSSYLNPKTGKRLAPRTIINYITQLSSIFSIAVQWEIITINPCRRIIKPKVEDPEVAILDVLESAYLLKVLKDEAIGYQCIVCIGLMTGLRMGEILALKWTDIDYEENLINVARSRTYIPKIGNYDKAPKTKTSKRSVVVPKVVLLKLAQLKSSQKAQQERLGTRWKTSDYLFTGYDGSPMGHNTPSRWFRNFILKIRRQQQLIQTNVPKLKDKIKLMPIIRFHDLRHTHASMLLAEGVDLATVSKRLGHAKTSTTANIYCHPMKGKDIQASRIIENLLVKQVI